MDEVGTVPAFPDLGRRSRTIAAGNAPGVAESR